ncbi:OsmC family protein [Pseudactinotalea sp. Z1748]|uniref:OsmC family protein n=1 Tax=Pseudactinotalea sp. Z1748 TaxID=3413027 RepID=UPI003C7B0C44
MTATATRATEPEIASIGVAGSWQTGTHTRVEARNFTLDVDEPPALGGADVGANPIEYILTGLSGCLGVVVQVVAAELGITVSGIESSATGDLDLRGFRGTAEVSPHFQSVDLQVHLTTTATADEVAELRRQVTARCPVLNLITDAGVDVHETWHVN